MIARWSCRRLNYTGQLKNWHRAGPWANARYILKRSPGEVNTARSANGDECDSATVSRLYFRGVSALYWTAKRRTIIPMKSISLVAGAFLAKIVAVSVLVAQDVPKRTPDQLRASYTAHKSDFDYLLGDWEFTAESKEYGKFGGLWSAVRLETGQILDEYRIVGGDGQTVYTTLTIRAFNAASERWELAGMNNGGGGLQDSGTGRRVGSEMHIEQNFGVAEGKKTTLRIRYYAIEPDRFSWRADRSDDGGVTWVSNFQRIEARRIGPSRELGRLSPRTKR